MRADLRGLIIDWNGLGGGGGGPKKVHAPLYANLHTCRRQSNALPSLLPPFVELGRNLEKRYIHTCENKSVFQLRHSEVIDNLGVFRPLPNEQEVE